MQRAMAFTIIVLILLVAIQTTRLNSLQKAYSELLDQVQETRESPRVDRPAPVSPAPFAGSMDAESTADQNGAGDDGNAEPTDVDVSAFHNRQDSMSLPTAGFGAEPLPSPDGSVDDAAESGAEIAADAEGTGSEKSLASMRFIAQARERIETGDYEQAEALLKQSLEEDPTNMQAYVNLGSLYRKMGLLDEEMRTFEQWVASDPDNPMSRYHLAQSYIRQQLTDDALREVGSFEELTTGDLSKTPMVASLYRQLNMTGREGEILQAWLDQVPDSPDAHRAMAGYYHRNGNRDAALTEYEKVVELIPQNANAHQNLASMYQLAGYYQDAVRELTTAMELRPEDANIQMQLGDAYRRGGNFDAAYQVYQAIIDKAPDSSVAERANQVITRMDRELNQ